ncbi:MAG: hypothetical protein QXP42_00805 [Candidatus Micrarchaeia archaeon]
MDKTYYVAFVVGVLMLVVAAAIFNFIYNAIESNVPDEIWNSFKIGEFYTIGVLAFLLTFVSGGLISVSTIVLLQHHASETTPQSTPKEKKK